jgi:hypothetical protein
MFFFPDVVVTDALPLTGGLAATALFGALLVKLMGDPDHTLRDFRLTTTFLGIGAALYFIPYILGVQGNAVFTGPWLAISNFLVTNTNPGWAVGIAYLSVVILAILGLIAAVYVLRTGGRAEVSEATTANE